MRTNETLIINIEYRIDRDIDTERHGEAQSSERHQENEPCASVESIVCSLVCLL